MTGGYEEWAAARTPSLLAFASAVTEDEQAADAAVTKSLDRIRSSWAAVARYDPDLEARRQVVRACSMPRRAAVVLRVLEDRSDAEIAEVLDCSESAARRHLRRRLDETHTGDSTSEVGTVREQLEARAGSAPTQLLTRPDVVRDHGEAPRRRRGTGLAVLAVVALVGGVAYVSHESRTPAGVINYPHVDVPTTWRYESYAGVELQVPDTWGWGASPVRSGYFSGPRHLGSCGAGQASVLSPEDDSSYVSILSGFVGRPAVLDHACVTYGSAGSMPQGDALWFDSPLSVGVKPVGSTVAETRAVGDQQVTVFSNKGDLRRQILGSAREVDVDDNGCPTAPVRRPTAGPDELDPSSLSVCVYSQDTGVSELMWSGTVPQDAARAYAAAVSDTGDDAGSSCPTTPTGRWVALGLTGDAGTRWDVVDLECVQIRLSDGGGVPLTPHTVESWASGGATAYLSAPEGARDLEPYFRAPPS